MSIVVTDIRRPDSAAISQLESSGVATVHEAQGRCGLLAPDIRPIFSGARIAGPAVTVSVAPCDNWMIHVAVEQCQAGDIVVVAPTSSSDAGYFGELLAQSLAARGVAGLIIDAGCRDIAELTQMRFPVWSRHIFAQGTIKETIGSVNRPVVCGGQWVNAGDVIVADDDGVVVVERDRTTDVSIASKAREAKEEQTRARLKAGELGLDIYGMRERLAAKGLTYITEAEFDAERSGPES